MTENVVITLVLMVVGDSGDREDGARGGGGW